MRSTAQGARTQVWLAASDEAMDESARGRYFVDQAIQTLDDYAQHEQAALRLWKESEEQSGFLFDLTEKQGQTSAVEQDSILTEEP